MSINPAILVYTNKQMFVRVYLDKERISDTPKTAETVISETAWRQFKKCKQNKKHHVFRLIWYSQLLLAARRKNTLKQFLLVENNCIMLFS